MISQKYSKRLKEIAVGTGLVLTNTPKALGYLVLEGLYKPFGKSDKLREKEEKAFISGEEGIEKILGRKLTYGFQRVE